MRLLDEIQVMQSPVIEGDEAYFVDGVLRVSPYLYTRLVEATLEERAELCKEIMVRNVDDAVERNRFITPIPGRIEL